MRWIQGCSNKKINMVTAFVLWQFNTSVRQLHEHCVYTNLDFTGCSEFWKASPKQARQVCSSSSAHYRLYFNLFIAGIPAPLFRKQIQLHSLQFQEFNSLCIYYMWIYKAKDPPRKHWKGHQTWLLCAIICFHLFSVITEDIHFKSVNISTITSQRGSPFSYGWAAALWIPFNLCQTENVQRKIILFTANTWDFK